MRVWRRIVAVLAVIPALLVLVLSLVGGVGVWVAKRPAAARAQDVFGRVDAALDIAEQGLDQAEASLARAKDRLDSAREEQKRLARDAQSGGAARRFLARTVQQRIAPDLGNTHEKLHTVAEASVVVNTVLEDFADFPLLSLTGLDSERVTELNSRLADVAPAAWELGRLLGQSRGESEDDGRELSRVEQTLTTVRAYVADYRARVTQVRERTEKIKDRTFGLLTPLVVAISLLCFWIAFSQLVVLSRARAWWRGSGNVAVCGRQDQALEPIRKRGQDP